ncbi:MAG: HAMP domain-containing protein [Alphaproteobacteria bacterium]|nr:HAMP domain-containing protein [Alphaproteobacteria bacterium]
MLKIIDNIKISKKLPMIMVALMIVGMGVQGYVSFKAEHKIAIDDARNKLEALVSGRSSALQSYLGSIETDLSTMAESPYVRKALQDYMVAWSALEEGQTEKLQKIYIQDNPHPAGQKENLDAGADGSLYSSVHALYHPWFRHFLRQKGYYDVFLFDPNGDVVYTVFKELDFATNLVSGQWKDTDLGALFRQIKSSGSKDTQFYYDFKPYSPSNNVPAAFIGQPIFNDDGSFAGAIAFQMPIANINKVMQLTSGMGESGETYLIGQDGLMRSDSRFIKTGETSILKTKVGDDVIKHAYDGKDGETDSAILMDYRGVEVFNAHTNVDFKGVQYGVIAEIDHAEVMAPVYNSIRHSLYAMLVILAVSILLVILVARNLSAPLTRMVDAMKKLANGENGTAVPGLGRGDEIGDMASAVQVFKENALEMERLTAEQERLKKQAEEDKKIAMNKMADDFDERTADIIAALASASTELQASATQMNKASDETSEISNTVAAAATQADANVQTVAAATEELTASSQEIASQISLVANMATGASRDAESTSVEVKKLQDMADSIGEVVGAIKDIAEQTNLLALNATIEAARAGEAGKGFAVVADEVKKLANETAQKTEQIDERVSRIQAAIHGSVTAMEKIISSVKKIDEATTSVTAAVEEQNAATAEIGRNVAEASVGTQQVSQNIVVVKNTAVETGQASRTVLDAAGELSVLSTDLKTQVDLFLSEIRGK